MTLIVPDKHATITLSLGRPRWRKQGTNAFYFRYMETTILRRKTHKGEKGWQNGNGQSRVDSRKSKKKKDKRKKKGSL